jgi:bacterioferritin-associated ferredoxin
VISRCVCHEVSFRELHVEAERRGLRTIEELRTVQDFAGNCRMCVPYVRKMLRTGETSFDVADAGDPEPV